MSVYMTEEEQLAAIKKWWQRYNTPITIILSLVLLVVSGVKYWNWHQTKINTQASIAFEHMMQAVSNQDNKSVRAFANQLVNDYSKTVYSDAAHLTLAKLYVSRAHLKDAESQLQKVANEGHSPVLQQVAKIRLARILASEKSYQQALDSLAVVNDEAYNPVINELKGDIYAQIGQYKQAMNAYRNAIIEVKARGMGNLFLEMKTNELAAKAASKVMAEKSIQSV